MFEFCRKYNKLLISILLGVFFVAFVVDDYGDEPQKAKGACTECFAEMEADDTEWEGDDLPEEACFEKFSLEINGMEYVFLSSMSVSSSHLSEKQFMGLVRRYAPRQNSTYNLFFTYGMNLYWICAIFYSENQPIKLWTSQVF